MSSPNLTIKKKFISDGAVDGSKILLSAEDSLKKVTPLGGIQELVSIDSSGELEFKTPIKISVAFSDGDQIVNKSYVDERTEGASLYSSAGAPNPGLGSDGDFYIDSSSYDIYGPKASGAWGSPTSLVGTQGPAGQNGATWYTGVGAPENSTGANNDLYLDTDSGDLYKKISENFQLISNLKGPQGVQGEKGDAGEQGPSGVVSATAPLAYDSLTKTVSINPGPSTQFLRGDLQWADASVGNLDGGGPSSVFGGISSINGGGVT